MRTLTLSGLAVVLASALSCSGEEPKELQESQDESLERPAIIHPGQPTQTQPILFLITPSNYFADYPTLQDLEDAVNASDDSQEATNYLSYLAELGSEFYVRVNRSLGDSLLYLDSFGYRFKNKEGYNSLLDTLNNERRNVEINSDCCAESIKDNKELLDILRHADERGHLTNAGKVFGYLNASTYGQGSIGYTFSSFDLFYGWDVLSESGKRGARVVLEPYLMDIKVLHEEWRDEAQEAYDALPAEIKFNVLNFVGKHVYKSLKDDSLSQANIPDAPTSEHEQDAFYVQIGNEVFAKCGIVDTFQSIPTDWNIQR